ncbi:MAG: peptide deformylase [Myxococcales bacterium]|nr:peptide deformylase [Myxococcales bacterium]
MILPIRLWPDPVLTKPSSTIEVFDDELRSFAENMAETMYSANGLGLAAPQVGELRRLIVVDVDPIDQENPHGLITLINPRVSSAKGQIIWEEGCLSFPGVAEKVKRPNQVVVEYQTVEGERRELRAEGILSVCVQHEIDHLNGVNFIDRLSRLKRTLTLREFYKLHPEQAKIAKK